MNIDILNDSFESPRERKRSIQESKVEAERLVTPVTKVVKKPHAIIDIDSDEPYPIHQSSLSSSSSSYLPRKNNEPLTGRELYKHHYDILMKALRNNPTEKREKFVPPKDICGPGHRVIYQGDRYVIPSLGQSVERILDHTPLLEKPPGEIERALWKAFRNCGYLYLRGILGRQAAFDAQHNVLGSLAEMQYATGEESRWSPLVQKGWVIELHSGRVIGGTHDNDLISVKTGHTCTPAEMESIWAEIGKLPSVRELMRSEVINALLFMLAKGKELSDELVCTPFRFDPTYSWLRVKNKGEFTAQHADVYHFRKCTPLFELSGGENDDEDSDAKPSAAFSDTTPVDDVSKCQVCKEALPKRKSKKQPTADDFLQCHECAQSTHLRCLFAHSEDRRRAKEKAEAEDWFCRSCNPRPVMGTAWIPLGDVDINSGVLAMLAGSQSLPGMKKKSSANGNSNEIPKSWFTQSKGLTWQTTDYAAGDLVLFDSLLVHATSANYEDKFRLSVDFRWYLQPQRDNVHFTWHGKVVADTTKPV